MLAHLIGADLIHASEDEVRNWYKVNNFTAFLAVPLPSIPTSTFVNVLSSNVQDFIRIKAKSDYYKLMILVY